MLAKYFFPICLLFVGGVALLLPSGYSVGFYLLSLTSFAAWMKLRGELFSAESKLFILPLCFYAAGHLALALNERWALRELDNYLPFLLVVFGLWGLRTYRPRAVWFWLGIALGSVGAAFFAAYQSQVLGLRAGGFVQAIQFGNIALLLSVLSLVRVLAEKSMTFLSCLLWLGFIGGLAASIWSQTRGGWVALILIFIWILVTVSEKWTPLKRKITALGVCLLLVLPALPSNSIVYSRIEEAVIELNAYWKSGKQDSSVGARLAMWTLAWKNIASAPLVGLGDKGWIELRDAAVADGRLSSFSSKFTHLHNEFLNVVFKRGLIGLALYLALYLVPMLMFFKPYLQHASAEVRSLAMTGMVIPMMYMDFGLTQTFLSHNSGRIVLCSFWMCVAGLLLNAVEDNKTYDAV